MSRLALFAWSLLPLALVATYCQSRLAWIQSAARSDVERTEQCRRLIGQIRKLREAPTVVSLHSQTAGELSKRLEQAAAVAGISREHLLRIEPQPIQRLAQSAYQQQATRIALENVSLPKLETFLNSLTSDQPSWEVTSLRLSVPRETADRATGDEPWSIELVLTNFIFAPISAGRP